MDISVPSRFACLKIEDDDFRPASSHHAKKKQEKVETKKPNSAAKEASKSSWTATRKKGNTTEKPKTATTVKKPKHKQKGEFEKNWEEWQKKDDEFVNDVFEEQMQNAIMQSKLEFEQQKKTVKSESEQNQGKKKKGKTMSWDQFVDNKEANIKEQDKSKDNEKNFFDDVVQTVKKEITREKIEENRKKRQEKFDEVVGLAQLQEKLEEERQRNINLEKQLKEARKEISVVKKRNTTLCSMLSQGEMKDKAEVLLELERLTVVKEELTEEVAKLYKLLEQERSSKTAATTNEPHLKHNKDKVIFL